jgi:hypothetical protein
MRRGAWPSPSSSPPSSRSSPRSGGYCGTSASADDEGGLVRGHCSLCGEEGPLTRDHVPPRGCANARSPRVNVRHAGPPAQALGCGRLPVDDLRDVQQRSPRRQVRPRTRRPVESRDPCTQRRRCTAAFATRSLACRCTAAASCARGHRALTRRNPREDGTWSARRTLRTPSSA